MAKFRKIKPEKIESDGPSLEADRLRFPHFGMDLEHLPEAKDWKIGTTYYVTLEIKQTSIEVFKNTENEEHGRAGFDITGLEVLNKSKKGNSDHLPDPE